MQSKGKNNLIIIRIFKEENVNKMIKEVCEKHKVNSAVIISGIGQLKNIKLGYFKEKGNYAPQTFREPLELLSLSGNICKDKNEFLLHLHAVLGDENKKAIGGHFIDGIVSVTAEIVLLKSVLDIKRKTDQETGLKNIWLR